jgi:hypothetical protein
MIECQLCGRDIEPLPSSPCVCTTTLVDETCAGCERQLTEAEALSYEGVFCFDCRNADFDREQQAVEDTVAEQIEHYGWKTDENIAREVGRYLHVPITSGFVADVRYRRGGGHG